MPKILFRPAPTPPPFVPPTPSYDTQIHATFEPLEFNPDTGLTVVFQNASLPDFDNFNIESDDGTAITFLTPASEFAFNTEIEQYPETEYNPSATYFLVLSNTIMETDWRCEIIIDNKP